MTQREENQISGSKQYDSADNLPDIDFRRDIANELTREELIDRLCDMQKEYVKMRQEWFNVVHLGEKSTLATKDLLDIDEAEASKMGQSPLKRKRWNLKH